jgi:hypothetical protein
MGLGNGALQLWSGADPGSKWTPKKEVFDDFKHIARSAQYHTLLSITKLTLPAIRRSVHPRVASKLLISSRYGQARGIRLCWYMPPLVCHEAVTRTAARHVDAIAIDLDGRAGYDAAQLAYDLALSLVTCSLST